MVAKHGRRCQDTDDLMEEGQPPPHARFEGIKGPRFVDTPSSLIALGIALSTLGCISLGLACGASYRASAVVGRQLESEAMVNAPAQQHATDGHGRVSKNSAERPGREPLLPRVNRGAE